MGPNTDPHKVFGRLGTIHLLTLCNNQDKLKITQKTRINSVIVTSLKTESVLLSVIVSSHVPPKTKTKPLQPPCDFEDFKRFLSFFSRKIHNPWLQIAPPISQGRTSRVFVLPLPSPQWRPFEVAWHISDDFLGKNLTPKTKFSIYTPTWMSQEVSKRLVSGW